MNCRRAGPCGLILLRPPDTAAFRRTGTGGGGIRCLQRVAAIAVSPSGERLFVKASGAPPIPCAGRARPVHNPRFGTGSRGEENQTRITPAARTFTLKTLFRS